MGMVVIQPYILASKQRKTKIKFLRCPGYLNYINKPIKQSKAIANSSSCTTTELSKLLTSCLMAVKNTLSSTVKRYIKDQTRIYFGLVKFR